MGFIDDSEKIAKIIFKNNNMLHSNGTQGNGTLENYFNTVYWDRFLTHIDSKWYERAR
jgi:hypothetical protein